MLSATGCTAADDMADILGSEEQVTVVVCTRDRKELLGDTLPSVVTSAAAAGARVIVVEQGDSGARATGLDVTVVDDPGTGASRARNLGLAACGGGIVAFTDDDCEVPPTWVGDLVAQLRRSGAAMALGPVEGMATGADIAPALRRHRPWLMGHSANMAVRHAVIRRLGGFDESLGAGVWVRGGEDADLILRFLDAGEAVDLDVGAPVRHLDWRSDHQGEALRLSYERGAGAFIGRAVRRHRGTARPYLAARVGFIREDTGRVWRKTHRPDLTAAPAAQFLAGFAVGLAGRPHSRLPASPLPAADHSL